MKLTVDKQKILELSTIALRVVGKKESLPVLSCFLCEAKKNELILRSTNLESGLEIHIPAEVKNMGVCAVPAHIFNQTIRTMRTTKIVIESDGEKMLFTSGASTTSVNTIPHNEFPSIPIPKSGVQFSLPSNVLLEGINSVSYAASQTTIRQEFASIFLTYKEGVVVFAATDSFRLAEKKIHTPLKKQPEDILIPVKNALDLLYIFEHVPNGDLICTVSDSQIHISSGPTSFVSRVVDATFPAYEAIIPKKTTTEAIILKEDLSIILQKAAIFSGESNQIGLSIYPEKKIFNAKAQHSSVGSMSDSIDATVSGENIDINFNTPYISDCLQSISSDSVVMKFSGPGKPLVLEGSSDKTFRYLVMPLNQ